MALLYLPGRILVLGSSSYPVRIGFLGLVLNIHTIFLSCSHSGMFFSVSICQPKTIYKESHHHHLSI